MRMVPAIRLSITPEMRRALNVAKRRYPTLSDSEILKLGLAKILTESDEPVRTFREREEVRSGAAVAVGRDYLENPEEDVYTADMGKSVRF